MNDDTVDEVEKFDKVLKMVLPAKDFKKVDEMNLPWAAYQELLTLVMSAMTGEEPEVIEERFPEITTSK